MKNYEEYGWYDLEINEEINLRLLVNDWDDFGFKTLFHLIVFFKGVPSDIGELKIGHTKATEQRDTIDEMRQLSSKPSELTKDFFSLGQDPTYYQNIMRFDNEVGRKILESLRDITFSSDARQVAEASGDVYNKSLLRTVSRTSILGQYNSIIYNTKKIRSNFNFKYNSEYNKNISFEFKVTSNSLPKSNIHVLIGSNGTGKTRIINEMINCLTARNLKPFFDIENQTSIGDNYFANILATSFSVFGVGLPTNMSNDLANQVRYHYIGLKEQGSEHSIKNLDKLSIEFSESIISFIKLKKKREYWISAIKSLDFDLNFPHADLIDICEIKDKEYFERESQSLFKKNELGPCGHLPNFSKNH